MQIFPRVAVPSCLLLLLSAYATAFAQPRSSEYSQLQERLARGWNTWDTHSVMTQVLLPEGLAVRVGIKHQDTVGSDSFLPAALIGRQGKDEERVVPGPHSYDGNYTDLKLQWRGHEIRIQSAHDGDDLVLLATPLSQAGSAHLPPEIVLSAGMLWNRPGTVLKEGSRLEARLPNRTVSIYLSGKDTDDVSVPVSGSYFSAELKAPVGLSTGRPRTIAEIQQALERARQAYEQSIAGFGERAPVADAIQTVIGWDTIYEPQGRHVISPVSRIWSVGWGGYVLFDWDTFFAATLAAVGDRDLAYANAIEICRAATPQGFIPNYARGGGWKSEDRSEPPVGAITLLGLYEKFHDRWLLADTFPALLKWNRWWAEHRDRQGYLVWGSDGENEPANLDDASRGTREGAILESGLDNSPMYDDAAYDEKTHQLMFADVGLMGMYISDCDALAKIADVLGKIAEATELRGRAAKYRASLATLWDNSSGIFLNKDLHAGQFSHRLSPTNFYPMLAQAATPEQARRMVDEHLLNPEEFWGQWVIPSIARNDPGFKDQNYWRGRIWGPMNYLVYLGLRNYHQPDVDRARRELAQKSLDLFLSDWRANGHVHENYNGATGSGDDVSNSDRFYHWGALLGVIDLEEMSPVK
ncbi:MGH1-like glycoside hydrolase domain-containing protein [Alloacidobacterium sp.]|uniref:MGH1-like glycoside hydrolase domain-containing protein n=1 Tax=Alloacidobacterium sp. TaxID=2951999 RepID=UPI002D39C9B5|nr:trehalase family glycosidase [Alloacidobacterium sp.]HYK36934.1 trehalase family glycosidase [Alloacidobacterium sp.]